jgi:hypothetical protein
MLNLILADGIFDLDEALIRIAAIVIVPLAIVAVGYVFFALSKIRKK